MGTRIFAYINLSLAMIIVGSSMVFGKVITQTFPVFLASGLRFAIASVLMLPLAMTGDKKAWSLTRKDLYWLILMAFCGQFVFTVLMLLGLRYTSAIDAGIITSSSPFMMALVAFFLLRERPGFFKSLAIVLVVLGILSVNGLFNVRDNGGGDGHTLGNLLMVGAVMGEAFFLLMRKQISPGLSNLALTAYLCFAGFIMFLPFSIHQALEFDFSGVSLGGWGSIVYFGAVFTVLAYWFWFQGVSRVSGSTAGVFSAFMPVSAVTLSCIFLDETFGPAHGIGIGLVLAAIFIMAFAPDKNRVGG